MEQPLQEERLPFGLGEGGGGGVLALARLQRPDQEVVRRKQCDLWAYVWTASSVLADVAAHVVAGDGDGGVETVELGAGCGLGSLAAAAAGAEVVVATDLVQDALDLIAHNAQRNGVVVRTARLDWKSDNDLAALTALLLAAASAADRPALVQKQRRRLVMGADILFSSWTVKPILAVIARLIVTDTAATACILVDPGRTNRDALEDGAADVGLAVVRRVDLHSLETPVALMRECTLFLLAPAAPSQTAEDPWCLAAFDDACARLRTTRCLSAADVAARGLTHGYTLPVVQ